MLKYLQIVFLSEIKIPFSVAHELTVIIFALLSWYHKILALKQNTCVKLFKMNICVVLMTFSKVHTVSRYLQVQAQGTIA
jgi:hypothetical protein